MGLFSNVMKNCVLFSCYRLLEFLILQFFAKGFSSELNLQAYRIPLLENMFWESQANGQIGGEDNFKNFLQFAKNFFSKFVIAYLRIINYAVLYVYWGDTNLFDKDH